jgi:Protein of unknown function (DUF 659)
MPPKRTVAPVLDHFAYVKTTVSGKYNIDSCNYCGSNFKRQRVGTDILKSHLAGTAVPCKHVPDDVRECFRYGVVVRTGDASTSPGTQQGRGVKLQQQLGASVNPALQKQAAKDIAMWAFATGTSFSAVHNEMFRTAMRSVAIAGVNFKPPTRRQLARTLLDSVYADTQKQVDDALNKHRKYGFSLCSDGWSDVHSHPLLNFVIMSAGGQFFLGSVDASGVTKSGDYISRVMCKYIHDVGAEDILFVVTDNASNCVTAGGLVEINLPHITWLGCIPHCLNLLMSDLGKLSWVSRVVTQVNKVCTHFQTAHALQCHKMNQLTSDFMCRWCPQSVIHHD